MLYLESLELYNWCNLQGTRVVEFTDGFNVINGENGGGKTSIVNAISILLLNKYEGNLEGFINDKSTDATAKLVFYINDTRYTSSIALHKAKSTSSDRHLYRNDTEIAKGEDCEKELEKLLPAFLTSYSLMYRQGSEYKVTECSDSDRRNLLTQLVSLDYSEKVAQFITPTVNTLTTQIADTEKELYALDNKTYTFGEEKVVPGEKYSQAEIEAVSAKVERFKNNEENLKKQKQLKESVETATKDFEEAKAKYDTEKLLAKKEADIAAAKDYVTKELANIEASRATTKTQSKDRMQGYLDRSAELEKELTTIVFAEVPTFDPNAVTDKLTNIAALKTRLTDTLGSIKSLESGVCPVCGGSCEHKLKDFQDQAADIEKNLATADAELNKAKDEKAAAEKITKENEAAKMKQLNLQAELSNVKTKIESEKTSVVAALQSLKEQEKILNDKLENDIKTIEYNTEAQIASSEELLKQKQLYLDNLKSQLDSIQIETGLEDCSDLLNTMQKKNAEIDECIAYNSAIREQNKRVTLQQAEDETEKSKVTEKLIDLKNQLADNKLAAELMSRTYPTWKLERDLKDIENKTNIFVEDIYKPLYVRFAANKNSLKMAYGNGERDLPIKRLSGAERQIVNLAVENVFNRQQNLSCIILDECDSAMDVKKKETFFSTLLSLQDHYKQLIVITHSNEVKDKLLVEGANIIML